MNATKVFESPKIEPQFDMSSHKASPDSCIVNASPTRTVFPKTKVKVVVGSGKRTWWLNEDLLCAQSAFFRQTFRGRSVESRSKEMLLEEESPIAFQYLVDWICGQKTLQCHKAHDDFIIPWVHYEEWGRLIKLSQLLMMDDLKEAAIERYKKCKNPRDWPEDVMPCPTEEEVHFICEHLPTSVLRQEIIHVLATTFLKTMQEGLFEIWFAAMSSHPDLIHDVMYVLKQRLDSNRIGISRV